MKNTIMAVLMGEETSHAQLPTGSGNLAKSYLLAWKVLDTWL